MLVSGLPYLLSLLSLARVSGGLIEPVISKLIHVLRSVDARHLALTLGACPLCDRQRAFVKFNADEIAVRCLACGGTPITLSVVSVLRELFPDLHTRDVYELSSRGPLLRFLRRACSTLTCSEFFDDVTPGASKGGVVCQDVQALTYPDASFDLCTSTEVFEHVPDDSTAFSEACRVLRPEGALVFSVPIDCDRHTIERARLAPDGHVEHLLPAEYHGDPIGKEGRILAYRNYGFDILTRLVESGFARAELRRTRHTLPWGYGRPVIVAYKQSEPVGGKDSDPLLLRVAKR